MKITLDTSAKIITDFSSADDTIQVLADDFVLRRGTIASDQFVLGSVAADLQDRFIYNSSDGALYFDPDGTGSTTQVQFATLSNNASLGRNDIVAI